MRWFDKLLPGKIRTNAIGAKKKAVPEGVWTKCEACNRVIFRDELELNLEVCPQCGHHMRLGARQRLDKFLDSEEERIELNPELQPDDPLQFQDSKPYTERLAEACQNSGEKEALIVMQGKLKGLAIVVAAFEFRFMGGSMGSVVGERFAKATDHCLENNLPLICFAASGGARMQEGTLSLMQMAKTSAALSQLSQRGIPYISILTDPTMGGVSASLAMLGDVNVAEPHALIGFAGPRVIEQTVRETLPKGFQRSEFLLEHGHIDLIIDRREMRDRIAKLIALFTHDPSL